MSSIIFGTSGLGNLFTPLPREVKKTIINEVIHHSPKPVVFDSAGKYGAGLALETLGKCLDELEIPPDDIIISNKLGWLRTELKTVEPTFEPGVWKNINHDAIQKIGYEGILECYEQGNCLLNGYFPQWVSVHDPDEYLASATTKQEEDRHYADILAAYRALEELKKGGKVSKIGIGAKNWNVIERISQDVQLDWVMFANSITVMRHPKKLMEFVGRLRNKGVEVINSAVFHSGFLVGTDYFDYKLINSSLEMYKPAYEWRERFFSLCNRFNVRPALACVQFSLKVPGINAIALNTTDPKRVKANIELTSTLVPDEFWDALKQQGLIDSDYPFLPF